MKDPLWTLLWTPYGPSYGPPMDPLWTLYGPPLEPPPPPYPIPTENTQERSVETMEGGSPARTWWKSVNAKPYYHSTNPIP